MEIQQIKHNEQLFGKSNYMWLCSKKVSMIWMSTRDEYRIRQVLNKVSFLQSILLQILNYYFKKVQTATINFHYITQIICLQWWCYKFKIKMDKFFLLEAKFILQVFKRYVYNVIF